MVPPESCSIESPQASSAFCNGCDGGTQCDSFSSKVLSWADAAPRLSAKPSAAKPHSLSGRVASMTASPTAVRRPALAFNRSMRWLYSNGCGRRLFRFRFVNAVPIRRRRIGAIGLDALDIHVVEPGDIETV